MNTTTLIIGIVVVVILVILIVVAVGLQRRKSKTVSFDKPAEQEPKELTQEEKSGNYQAQGGFNFAPAKPAEKEPEVLPGQELGSSTAGATAAGAAGAAAAAGAMKGEENKPDTRIQPDEARQTPEKAADGRKTPDAVTPVEDVDPAAATGKPAAEEPAPDTEASLAQNDPADPLTAEAEAGDLAAAETIANTDNYQVVSETDPATPADAPAPTAPETEEPVKVSPEVADHLEETAPVEAEPVSDAPIEKTPEAPAAPEPVDQPVEAMTEPVEVTPEAIPETAAEDVAEDIEPRSPAENEEAAEEAAEAAQVTAEVAEAAREQTPVPDTPAEPAPEPLDDIAPAAGRLGQLRSRLSRSQNVIGQGVLGILTAGDLDEDAWEEIEDTLIMADLGTTVTMKVVDSLRDKIAERGVNSEAEARSMLRETLIEAARPELDRSIKAMPYEGKPAVVLVVGVNGTGKTTTTGKLARVLVSMGHKVLLGAADTFRAAAADQLETWGDRVGARTVRGAEGADPASVAFDAVAQGVTDQADVVLIDTAGRLHTSTGLMDQLGKVKRVVEKKTDVDEVLLVLDATVGQNGLIQARTFREVVDISGVVLTKLDGTAKGGIVFQVQEELGVPVKLVGLGEGADHLAPFEVESFVDALLG